MLKPLHSAILLIAGTSVGAGMLALPVGMSQLGFIPSVLLMTWVWYIMYLSALLMLEVNLRFEPGTNIISMAGISFGIMGVICLDYLFVAVIRFELSLFICFE